jgi:predicted AlkP superfamily phosphohydrolase/phosphomutase
MGILFGRAGSALEALPGDHPLIDPSSPESIYAKETRILKKHMEALSMLSRRDDWDFVMYVTRGTDAMLHFYWDRKNVLLDFFRLVDEQLSILLKELDVKGGTNFFVVSDHGFASAPTFTFNGGDWIYQKSISYLSPRRPGVYLHLKASRAVDRWKGVPPVQSMFVTARNRLESLLPVRVVPWIGAIVADESKIDRMIDDLSSLKAPGDGSVFSMVKRCEEVYSGRKLELAPDIVWVPSSDCLPTNHFRGEITSKTSYLTPGAHWGSRRGLLMAIGPDIKTGGVPVASMLDVAPTAYCLLSIPIPSDLDGRVLEELIRPESLEDLHIARGPTSIKGERTEMEEDTDESEIRSRLRALGYVE